MCFSCFHGIRVLIEEIWPLNQAKQKGFLSNSFKRGKYKHVLVMNVNFYRYCIDLDFVPFPLLLRMELFCELMK